MAVNGGHAGTKKGPNWGHVIKEFGGRYASEVSQDDSGPSPRDIRDVPT